MSWTYNNGILLVTIYTVYIQTSIHLITQAKTKYKLTLKAWSHRIVRYLDRATGENVAEVRPIGNFRYDLDSDRMQRLLLRLVVGHRTIDGTRGRCKHQRLEKIDRKSNCR
jgi:hypothetical protein